METKELVKDLIEGRLSMEELYRIISSDKNPGRFKLVLEVLQEKVPWDEKIILPLSDSLFIVCKDNKPIVKCKCGFEFGDYRVNWKLKAKVFVRDTLESLQELYKPFMHSDPNWTEIREYYCPGCFTLLETEVVPPGYPVIFDFLPDINAFYREWLGEEPPCEAEFMDKTLEYIRERMKWK